MTFPFPFDWRPSKNTNANNYKTKFQGALVLERVTKPLDKQHINTI